MKQRIRVIGQLITDTKPVVLAVVDTAEEAGKVVKEYVEVYPDIFINAERGYFAIPPTINEIVAEIVRKKIVYAKLALIIGGLQQPFKKMLSSLNQMG